MWTELWNDPLFYQAIQERAQAGIEFCLITHQTTGKYLAQAVKERLVTLYYLPYPPPLESYIVTDRDAVELLKETSQEGVVAGMRTFGPSLLALVKRQQFQGELKNSFVISPEKVDEVFRMIEANRSPEDIVSYLQ